MADPVNLLDLLAEKNSMYSTHTWRSNHSNEEERLQLSAHEENSIKRAMKSSDFLDEYTINHGLSEQDIRIIFKIMAKDYQDAGRKRGAILRYINHYKEVEAERTNVNKDLYTKLNNIVYTNKVRRH